MAPDERFLALGEVRSRTTLSKTEIYRRMHAGTFPRPVHVAPFRVAWLESELRAWMSACAAERDLAPVGRGA